MYKHKREEKRSSVSAAVHIQFNWMQFNWRDFCSFPLLKMIIWPPEQLFIVTQIKALILISFNFYTLLVGL